MKTQKWKSTCKAGYIKKTSAGIYMMLPLGLRVQDKVEKSLESI